MGDHVVREVENGSGVRAVGDLHAPELTAAAALDGDHDGLLRGAGTGSAGGSGSNEDLVELDIAAQLLPVRPHHGPTQFVHPCPCGLV